MLGMFPVGKKLSETAKCQHLLVISPQNKRPIWQITQSCIVPVNYCNVLTKTAADDAEPSAYCILYLQFCFVWFIRMRHDGETSLVSGVALQEGHGGLAPRQGTFAPRQGILVLFVGDGFGHWPHDNVWYKSWKWHIWKSYVTQLMQGMSLYCIAVTFCHWVTACIITVGLPVPVFSCRVCILLQYFAVANF